MSLGCRQDLHPVLERRYRRTETQMKDMSDLLRHEDDADFLEWMAEAREKGRPKRPSKKVRKAKKYGESATGRFITGQRFSSKQLLGNA